ncbi:MAG: hypothetical protein D6722_18680 [Bacteroidetes bacterium]|nr:MAG: hypothetical protein D6722_18680 [Bacteroidota bacterium]
MFLLLFLPEALPAQGTYSVARRWNEALLQAIREDFARPTVHARNLFHTSLALYDAWAVYDPVADPWFLGKTVGDYTCLFAGVPEPADRRAAQEEAMSYAAFRLLTHRFQDSPGGDTTLNRFQALMDSLGYDRSVTSADYTTGYPAALGNYLGQELIRFGLQDGANEASEYGNRAYFPVNVPLVPTQPGNPGLFFPNRWQPLSFDLFIDQSGNPIPGFTPPFLSPEWGHVVPFSLQESDKTVYRRNGFDYPVYHDPGPPPYIEPNTAGGATEWYKWNFALVAVWGAHLDPGDSVRWDISPASKGGLSDYPQDVSAYPDFYNLLEGGTPSPGYEINPHTGQPYEPQYKLRGDYARVLAEFWADGPDSETPPGHWFYILNHVSDHPLLEKRIGGEGPVVDDLAWDVQAYFALGGAMHDAAISAWGIKGWYDYVRPISAIRWMAGRGQSSDPNLPNYAADGIPLIPGFIELVMPGDSLAGPDEAHLHKIKLYSWRGPDFIDDPKVDMAGVGWILAENWWPYQRPTFITPPFAGYVSGHSTYSRAAAEVLTKLTGDPFFPGGMSDFRAPKNEFLVFEEGPSEDIILQWATYRDASDQTSLSRLWGGIHPPADDIPGRLIGEAIGLEAYAEAEAHFRGRTATGALVPTLKVYPNPATPQSGLTLEFVRRTTGTAECVLLDLSGREVFRQTVALAEGLVYVTCPTEGLAPGLYQLRLKDELGTRTFRVQIIPW